VAQFELLSKHKDSLEKVSKLGEDIKKLRKTIEGDDVVGDSGTQCYVDIAKRTHPDPWGSTQGIVASTIRDVFRSHDFEDLFNAQPGTTDLQTGVDSLQLAAIQKFVQNKVKENKFGSGLEVDFINIEEIEFPEMIREKMEEQITSIVESRIMTTKANARIQEADAKRQVMITEAQAIQDAMASRANAMRIEEQMRTEIKADYYRRIIQTLQEEGQSIDTIQEVLKSLASTSAWEDEFRQLIQMMRPYIQIDQNIRELPSSLANGRGWTTRITNSND
jgi:hypothetical protein